MHIGITALIQAEQNLSVLLRNGVSRKFARNLYPLITFDNDLYLICLNALSQSPAAFVITSDKYSILIAD